MAEQAQDVDTRLHSIDWPIFSASVALLLALILPLMAYPDEGRDMLAVAFDYLTTNFGVLYIVAGIASLVYLLVLAFGRYGSIVFARDETTTQFSTVSWSAMLFCGGIGSSVLYWGTIEWAHYFTAPPFEIAAQSEAALLWSTSYPIFHWGFIGWAFYCLPGIAMGYAYYVKGADGLRLSAACADVIPQRWQPVANPIIDVIFVIGLVGACSTGIGLAVPLIGTLSSDLLNLPREEMGFAFDVVVIVLITLIFALSAWLGLEKGIKRLSNINLILAFGLLLFVLIFGPTLFILELSIETVGHLMQNFIRMSTWADAGASSNFVESWTIFYWAWWLALGPFMGLFIAKISRGRTIKEIVLGCLGFGTLGCTVFFLVLGNYAAYLEFNGVVAVVETMQASGSPAAILAVLQALPASSLVIFAFMIIAIIFAATSYDSASYTLATAATRNLGEGEDPTRAHRIFWACLLGLLPITLIYMGGLRPLQSAVTIASVPLLVVLCIATWSLAKNLKADSVSE